MMPLDYHETIKLASIYKLINFKEPNFKNSVTFVNFAIHREMVSIIIYYQQNYVKNSADRLDQHHSYLFNTQNQSNLFFGQRAFILSTTQHLIDEVTFLFL